MTLVNLLGSRSMKAAAFEYVHFPPVTSEARILNTNQLLNTVPRALNMTVFEDIYFPPRNELSERNPHLHHQLLNTYYLLNTTQRRKL